MGQVTYYTVATWFAQMVRMPLDLASFALIPMICARKNLADFGRSTLMYFLGFLAALAPLIFLAGWFIGRPLMILYGKDTLAEASDMLCVVLGGKSVQVIYVLALGFLYKFWTPRTMMILSVLALMVNFGASFWLVPQHGAIGAAWANAIACAFQGIVALGLMLHRFHGSTKPGGGSPVAASGA
jgi:Na+-driven multidrug efflux pump